MTEDRQKIIFIMIAILTMLGGVAVWVYTELKTITRLEAAENHRQEWLDRWMEERELRLQDFQKRIERLEQKNGK